MTADNQSQPNATSDELERTLADLTLDQVRFVLSRQECSTDKEAAERVGVKPATVKRWKYDGAPIDDAVRLMIEDGLVTARHLRRRSLAKAMAIKIAGLDERDPKLRQAIATEIIEWEMGKATQRQEVTGEDGSPLAIRFINDWRNPSPDAT